MDTTKYRKYFKPLAVTAHGLSDVGCKRDHNEDAILVSEQHGVFCVADGMGGLRAGEIASGEVVKQLREVLAAPRPGVSADRAVGLALRTAHEALWALATAKHWLTGDGRAEIGTTASVLVCDIGRQRGVIHHIGDSRVYRLRGDELRQLTTDHNLEAEVRRKLGAGQDVKGFNLEMAGSVLTQALGFKKDIAIDEISFDLAPGDSFLLCSDGLIRHVADDEIREALQASSSLSVIAEGLLERTKSRGAEDNVSIIVLRVSPDRAAARRRCWMTSAMALALCLLAVGGFWALGAFREYRLREMRQSQLAAITVLRSPAVQATDLELAKIQQAAERASVADPAIAPQLQEFMLRWREDLLREYRTSAQDGIARRDWQRLGDLPPLSSDEFQGLSHQSDLRELFAFSSRKGELERLWWQLRNALKGGVLADIDAQAQSYWAIVGALSPDDPTGALVAMKLTAGVKRQDALGALLHNWPFGQDMNDVKDALMARLNEEHAAAAKEEQALEERKAETVLPPVEGVAKADGAGAAAKGVSGIIRIPLPEAKPKKAAAPPAAAPVQQKQDGKPVAGVVAAVEPAPGAEPAGQIVPAVVPPPTAPAALAPRPFAGVLAEFRQKLVNDVDYSSWRWLEEQRPAMSDGERDAAFTVYMDALTLRAASIRKNRFEGVDAFVFGTCGDILANVAAARQRPVSGLIEGLQRHYVDAGEELLRAAAKSGAWAEALVRLDANPQMTAALLPPAQLKIAREWQVLLEQWRVAPAQADAAMRELRDIAAGCQSLALLDGATDKAGASGDATDAAALYRRYLDSVAEAQQRFAEGRGLCREHLALLRLPIWDKIASCVPVKRAAEIKALLDELQAALAAAEAGAPASGDTGVGGVLSPTAYRERLRAEAQALREMEKHALAAVALLHAEMTKQEELSHRVKNHAFVSEDEIYAVITASPAIMPVAKLQALCRVLTPPEP